MGLGINTVGNNWKYAVVNFLVTFGVQAAFKLEEIVNQGTYPSEFECVKIVVNSLTMTLIFYGYNKYAKTEKK